MGRLIWEEESSPAVTVERAEAALAPAAPTQVHVSVVLAAYNEAACLAGELQRIRRAMDASRFTYEVVLVDDASTDGTTEIAKAHPWVRLIRHAANRGSGGARKTGTVAARGDVVVWTDVDNTYPNDQIPALVEMLMSGYDQVIGARTSERGTWKLLRSPAKWLIRQLAQLLADKRILDLNSGYRAFRRSVAAQYLYLLPNGFSCVSTITLAFLCNGHSVGYLPISYHPRVGRSKFHPIRDTWQYVLQVVRMVTYFKPLKVFLPVSGALMAIGLVESVRDVAVTGSLQEIDIIIFLMSVLIGMLGLLADLIVTGHKRPSSIT